MSKNQNILILSKDPEFFKGENFGSTEVVQRHIKYFLELRRRAPNSCLTIFTISKCKPRKYSLYNGKFSVIGIYPYSRVFFLFFLFFELFIWFVKYKNRPDVITSQTPWEEGVLGYFFAFMTKARFIPQIHFDITSLAWRRETRLNRWRYFVSKAIVSKSVKTRVVSEFQKGQISDAFAVDRSRLVVVPALMQLNKFQSEEFTENTNRQFNVIFVGRFVEAKNLDLWLDVAELLAAQSPRFNFTLAGDGPLRQKLEQRVKSSNLVKCTKFTGQLNSEQLKDLYSEASLLLLTSNYEGFGRVLVEAQSCGVLVCSTSSGGPNSIIENNVSGLLFENTDSVEIARAINELSQNSKLQLQLQQKGFLSAINRFSEKQLASQLVDLWIN